VIPVTLSACFLFLAFPPFHFFIPSFIALIPLTSWVVGLENSKTGSSQALWGGFFFGVVYGGLILHWVPITLWNTSPWSAPAYLVLVVILAFPKACFGWILHRLIHREGIPICLALAFSWTALEWSLANLPGAFAFPWLELGTSLTGYPEVVGSAELIGARGVTFWIALLNGLLLELIILFRNSIKVNRLLSKTAAIVLIFSLPVAWGFLRANSLPVARVGQVTVVQPNIIGKTKMSTQAITDSTLSALEKLNMDGAGQSTDLIVLPEATFWTRIEVDMVTQQKMSKVFENWDAPVLVGGIGLTSADYKFTEYNSSFLFDPREGLTDFRYDKHYLVPWFETMPLSLFRWRTNSPNFSEYGRGDERSIGEIISGMKFGVLICYESIFSEHSRLLRMGGADILVNITNDVWLQSEWGTVLYRTLAFWQHPAHLVMRAIENRVGIARSSNTGFSFFVDPLGHVYGELESSQLAVGSSPVYGTQELTLYTRMGDLAGLSSFLVTILMLINVRFRFYGA
tara:strand:- start:14918 stop:16459 length:1542 start_codon:yes stop_codon:yes gene_type:complete